MTGALGLGCSRGCRGHHRAACVAAREITYLGQVGALPYLDRVCDALGGRGDVGAVSPVNDTGLEPCACARCQHGPGEKRGGHDVAAFKIYAEAEATALRALADVSDDADLAMITKALRDASAEGARVRDALASKGHPVPGDGGWLISAQEPLEGGAGTSKDAPGASGTPGEPEALRAPSERRTRQVVFV